MTQNPSSEENFRAPENSTSDSEESRAASVVEGGATVADSFLRQGFVHRIHFYYAPRIIGGQKALSSVSGKGVKHLSETPLIQNPEWMPLGDDFLLMADVAPVSR